MRDVVHRVEYINDGADGRYVVCAPGFSNELTLCSSDLYYLGHKSAGDSVNNLRCAIDDVVEQPHKITGDVEDFNKAWYRIVRSMRPSFKVLLSFKFKV